jgi:hypothetical protein
MSTPHTRSHLSPFALSSGKHRLYVHMRVCVLVFVGLCTFGMCAWFSRWSGQFRASARDECRNMPPM